MTAYAMPKIGDVIAAKYRLEKVAGEGGMGIVYAAEHLVLKQRVAVKVLLPDAASSELVVERFAREARAAAKINSEHVARVLDAGSLSSGAPFLVMEYLEGCDLEELLQLQRTLPIAEAAEYLVQALEGLAHAHAAGIVHRDLKPANLFLACRPDGANAIKLLDFGISKTTKSKPEDKRLTGHHVLGSPVYMSPEQLRNATDIDSRADIWSIGVVGYELLAGVPPFDGDGVGEIFAAILEKSPVPLSEANPKVPEELSNVLARCIRRDPAERWADVAQLARAIAPFGNDALVAVVDRAEQVLARARSMKVQRTPVEARRVVEAIDAAAERAMTTATKSVPPLPRRGGGAPLSIQALARRSPARTAGLALGGVMLIGGIAYGAVRAKTPAPLPPFSNLAPSALGPPPAAPPAPVTAAPTGEASAAPVAEEEPPLLMDLPPSASSPRSRPSTSGKPTRPKFLNTRE